MMSIQYTAIITKDDDWWLGWIEELPGAKNERRITDKSERSCKGYHSTSPATGYKRNKK